MTIQKDEDALKRSKSSKVKQQIKFAAFFQIKV